MGGEEHHGESKAPATLGAALWTIIIADLSMSLDNVLGVAGAAHGNFLVLVIGLLVSIVLMGFAATAMANLLTKYPAISWIGLMMIFFVAMEMILTGTGDVSGLTFEHLPSHLRYTRHRTLRSPGTIHSTCSTEEDRNICPHKKPSDYICTCWSPSREYLCT